jgi:ADP-ribose pyrophosphatase YjhB (NUDIX family)
MGHCYQCGHELQSRWQENRLREVCPACGWVFYPQLKVSAAALVEKSGALLLVRRKTDPWAGCWYLPAGFVEADEDPYRAAERELNEETGLEVKAGPIREMWFFADDPRGNGLLLVIPCEITGGRLRDTIEAEGADFFNPEQIPQPLAGAGHAQSVASWCAKMQKRPVDGNC